MAQLFKVLAESENYRVESEYESVKLRFKNDKNFVVTIGDFYGDPTCALISANEKYVVMGGYGLIIYFLTPPYQSYQYDCNTNQWREFFRDFANHWWIETIYQSDIDNTEGDWDVFKFVALNNEDEKIYKIDLRTNEISLVE